MRGEIAGARIDTIYPELVLFDNPLIHLSEEARGKIIYTPHTRGITTNTFQKVHKMFWKAFEDVAAGKEPENQV